MADPTTPAAGPNPNETDPSRPGSSERWAEISARFDEFVDLAPGERQHRLDEIARTDPALADELGALLAADADGNALLDGGARAVVPNLLDDAAPADRQAGAYRLLRKLGEGGMGVVWLGERIDGAYEKQVAVKILKRGMDTHAILRRFLQERRILARLDHPYIVRLVDGGMSSDARPFYVMDHVEGESITTYAAIHQLDVGARVALLAAVADAVAYAHTQLVVHRDLKPSNVLVDGTGAPRVLDFGIAKLIEESNEQTLTGTGMRVLSPAYAAPEQLLGEAIGTTTDVHALGLMLCELLTGQLPWQQRGMTPAQRALDASQQVVDRASTLVARLDGATLRALYGDAGDARELERKLAGDLDLIITTALQREPSRRYPTAAALGDDLRRWLEGRPIAARPDTPGYRLKKFVRRHRAGVAASALITLALIGGFGVALWQAHLAQLQATRADAEAVSARQNAERSRRVTNFLISVFTQEDPLRHTEGGATTLAQAFDDTLKRIDSEFADDPMLQGELLDDFGEITTTKGQFEQAQALFLRALALAERTHAADDPAVAETLVNLGVLASYRGDVGAGKPYVERAVAILEPHAEERPGEYANALSALAKVVLHEGNLRETARLMRLVLDIQRKTKAPPDGLAGALSNVATSQASLGNFAEAESLANEALGIAERAFGKDSANVIPPLWTLETTAYQRGDLDQEQRLVERRLAVARAALPPQHPWVAGALGESGYMLMRNGQAKEGEARMREALQLLEQGGNKGDGVQMIQRRLWMGLRQNGDARAAREAIEAAWNSCTAQQHQQYKLCLTVRANRAQSLADAGQGELALVEADAAAQALQQQLGESSDDLAQALEARASALLALRRRDEALAAQREAVAMFEAVYGAQHVASLRAREALARM